MLASRLVARLDALRPFAVPSALVLWWVSLISQRAHVHGSWLAAMLALVLAGLALPPLGQSPQRYSTWTVTTLAPALALIAALRASAAVTATDPLDAALCIGCLEGTFVLMLLWLGRRVEAAVTARLHEGRGRWRPLAALAAMALGVALLLSALTRFEGRVEPSSARASLGETRLGLYQPLGARCPRRCDQGPRAVQRGPEVTEATDDVLPGVSLTRRRLGVMVTRFELTVSPPGRPPSTLPLTSYGGQPLELSLDPSGRLVSARLAAFPERVVRLSDGAVFTGRERDRAGETSFHAPVAYVLASCVGLAMAAWCLHHGRRSRREASETSSWRDARVEADGLVHFDEELPPAPLPDGAPREAGPVVVTRCVVPAGVGYRSSGLVTIEELHPGTREDLTRSLLARASAWEHGALACAVVTHAPLVGVWLGRTTW